MLVTQKRPRDLKWFLAGPLLYGDWGTSRLYVLGLAFYFAGHASPLYLGAMGLLMAAVAWAYSVVCRCFPDGGGVYTASRQLSPTLSVIGATLLLCDYIVTASLSAVEAFHYIGAHEKWVVPLCVVTIIAIGAINWLGARSAGKAALIVAIASLVCCLVIAVMSLPLAYHGLSTVTTGDASVAGPWTRWQTFVHIVLALSGIEAIANMTGLMAPPVARTARRSIWPVLCEVVLLNIVFSLAINALPGLRDITIPSHVQYEVHANPAVTQIPSTVIAARDTAMDLLARHVGGETFATITSVIFGLLLLSAVNTAVMAMVSVTYSMAHDKELPSPMTRLNFSGVPWVGLVIACILPVGVLLFEADVKALGELYAIGVVGAIAINLLSCAANSTLEIKRWERKGLWVLGVMMAMIEVTIVIAKPHATMFATTMVLAVLALRFVLKRREAARPAALPVPTMGWLAELERPPLPMHGGQPRIMLAARGRHQAEFAVDLARRRGGALFTIYVRTLRVLDVAPGNVPRVADDPEAAESLGTAALLARQYGVPFVPIYVVGGDIVEEILDYTVTYGCDTLILGKSRRRAFSRVLEGDVVSRLAGHLPSEVALITREATPHSMPPPQHEGHESSSTQTIVGIDGTTNGVAAAHAPEPRPQP